MDSDMLHFTPAGLRDSISRARRIVIKIGTNTLSRSLEYRNRISTGPESVIGIDSGYLHRVALQIAGLMSQGKEIIIVTSGAIGMGSRELGFERKVTEVNLRQACAAIGQPLLMNEYHKAFGVYGMTVAQLLVTRESWDQRSSYLNLKNAVETLLGLKVVPVFNENDSISTAEIGNAFGDNDQLSAYIASKIDAELLILLSDIDALYDSNPRENPQARAIPYVKELTPEILAAAGGKGSEFSTGGMKTKLKAVDIAGDAGCRVIIAHGRADNVIQRICEGEEIGTLFEAHQPLKNRSRWIKNARAQGTLKIDPGALAAVRHKNSLLVTGLLQVEGTFDQGAIVLVNDAVKLITSFSSDELRLVQGKHSAEIDQILGPGRSAIIARPEDMVFIDHPES